MRPMKSRLYTLRTQEKGQTPLRSCLALLVSVPFLLGATAFEQNFDTATKAYQDEDFVASVRSLEQLIGQGIEDVEVFYNLGNAYYRMNMLGPAIANFERARLVDPRMKDAEENLFRAVNRTERGLSRPEASGWMSTLLSWDGALSPRMSYGLACVAWVLFWSLLGIRHARSWPYLRTVAAVLIVAAVGFGASAWRKAAPSGIAVAMVTPVPVRYGAREQETVHFELYEGDRVLVDRQENEWVHVHAADGEDGWVKRASLAFVGPPYEPFWHYFE